MVTIEEISKRLDHAWNKFTDWISTGLGAVWSFFAPLIDEISNAVSDLWNEALSAFQDAWNLAQDAWDKAQQAWDAAITAVSDAWGNIIAAVDQGVADAKMYADGLVANVEGVTEGFVLAITDGIQASVDSLNDVVDSVRADTDSLASYLNDVVINFDLWVQSSIEMLMDLFIETEEESRKYRKGGAS